MATRYLVEWCKKNERFSRGFSFRVGALELWADLTEKEVKDEKSGIFNASIRYLGPNGERFKENGC